MASRVCPPVQVRIDGKEPVPTVLLKRPLQPIAVQLYSPSLPDDTDGLVQFGGLRPGARPADAGVTARTGCRLRRAGDRYALRDAHGRPRQATRIRGLLARRLNVPELLGFASRDGDRRNGTAPSRLLVRPRLGHSRLNQRFPWCSTFAAACDGHQHFEGAMMIVFMAWQASPHHRCPTISATISAPDTP